MHNNRETVIIPQTIIVPTKSIVDASLVPSLINAPIISWFYGAPPSEMRDGLRLVSWSSVLLLAKPPLVHF